jgi:hypothetical protein
MAKLDVFMPQYVLADAQGSKQKIGFFFGSLASNENENETKNESHIYCAVFWVTVILRSKRR